MKPARFVGLLALTAVFLTFTLAACAPSAAPEPTRTAVPTPTPLPTATAILTCEPFETTAVAPPASVPTYGYQVINTYPHDPDAFTQGLVYTDGLLYESTGIKRTPSSLRQVELTTGEVTQLLVVGSEVFGEGLVLWQDKLIQLTWQNHIAFVYDRASFELLDTWEYDTEGWGITHDGRCLIMSDGTSTLTFRDPDTFKETGFVYVHEAGHRFTGRLNELECADGVVYANVWTAAEDRIVKIDPATGNVVANIDAAGLLTATETRGIDVLNGIAFVPERGTFLITGKFWPRMFEVRFRPKGEKGAAKSRAAK